MAPFTTDHIPDMSGRTVIITGANSGIGHAAAQALATAGARVVLAVRDPAKGEAAAANVPGTTEVRPLDLASLDSVRAFAASMVNVAWACGERSTSACRAADGA